MNADGSNPVRLTNDPGIDEDPSVHPSGRFIAFDSDRSGDLDIYQMRIDGSNVIQIEEPDSQDFDPVYSPDGRSSSSFPIAIETTMSSTSSPTPRPSLFASPTTS